MHDDPLERRLRTTLRDEADRLPFTITAAELERRISLRGRMTGSRRLTLLLAAAVAIGGLGVGGLIGGMLDPSDPSPAPSPVAEASQPPETETTPPASIALPDLDELLAADEPGVVVFAQTHGPASGPEPVPGVVSLVLPAPLVRIHNSTRDGDYAVTLACRGGTARIFVSRDEPDLNPQTACDGRVQLMTVRLFEGQDLRLVFSEPASWRVVLRRAASTGPTTPPSPARLEVEGAQEELSSIVDATTAGGSVTPTVTGMLGTTQKVDVLPARLSYHVQASCVGTSPMRFAFGDDATGTLVTTTITQVPCDGRAHAVLLGVPEPFGTSVHVAAEPTTTWSLLVASLPTPVRLAEDLPGWTTVAGIGPELEFVEAIHSFAGLAVDGGGPFRVSLDCAVDDSVEGSVEAIEVKVQGGGGSTDLGSFVALCAPGGLATTETFETQSYDGVRVEYAVVAGQWTALSILVPDEAIAR
jgi:hypothetical protein